MKDNQEIKNLTPEFWEWAAGLTETWEFKRGNKTQKYYVRSKDSGFVFYIDSPDKEPLESFVYQAIDGLPENWFYQLSAGVVDTGKFAHMGEFERGSKKSFIVCTTKTAARLAALYWIFEHDQKKGTPK